MDEAGDMLTVAPNLQDDVEEAHVEKISEAIKRKEWERTEKWRKMAKVIHGGEQGQGMEFEFDVKNPKLIERTWKGIPDRWRATAWWAFLESAAKESKDAKTAQELIAEFHRLQTRWSPDDGQIDLDVPRTVGRHVMFRKRYTGGQRLLFRVLHALSIHFPDTGYVQGMASLAATLLCYFDEEKCFVMLVRMWQLRGLHQLYLPGDAGLDGLMAVLHAFDASWLSKEVGNRLVSLPTYPDHRLASTNASYRVNLDWIPQHMAQDGTSRSSISRFHFPHNFASGTSSSSVKDRWRRTQQPALSPNPSIPPWISSTPLVLP